MNSKILPSLLPLLLLSLPMIHSWTTTSTPRTITTTITSLRPKIHSHQPRRDRTRTRTSSSSSLFVSTSTPSPPINTESYDDDDDENSNSKSTTLSSPNPSLSSPKSQSFDKIAIVLNTNARGVTKALVDTTKKLVEEETSSSSSNIQLHITSTIQQAVSASHDIVKEACNGGNTLVIPVGGDGTLTNMIDLLWQQYSLLHQNGDNKSNNLATTTSFPISFGYIPMGTGNALGSVIGCTASIKATSKRQRMKQTIQSIVRRKQYKLQQYKQTLQQLMGFLASTTTTTTPTNTITIDTVELPLMQVTTTPTKSSSSATRDTSTTTTATTDHYTFFAGVGFDSLMLQDYKEIQEWIVPDDEDEEEKTSDTTIKEKSSTTTQTPSQSTPTLLKRIISQIQHSVLGGVTGYTVALFTKTLPGIFLKDQNQKTKYPMNVRISTLSAKQTHWIDHRRGDLMRPVVVQVCDNDDDLEMDDTQSEQPTILYEGSAGIVAAATTPFYGGGLRLFPFARMTTTGMHLRIGRINPLRGVLNIPRIFSGSYRERSPSEFGCIDFVGTQFIIDIISPEEGYPVQHSGEAIGLCQHVEFTVSGDNNTDSERSSSSSSSSSLPPAMKFVTLMPPRLIYE